MPTGGTSSANWRAATSYVAAGASARPDAVPFGELPGPALEAERSGDANQVMYLPFTSGTTGEPKGVMHSDNTLLATARMMARDWRLERAVLYTLVRSVTISDSVH